MVDDTAETALYRIVVRNPDEEVALVNVRVVDGDLGIDYLVGAGERLPQPSASFDTVVCVDVLEHVSDLGAVIAEIGRVLRPGGLFLFDTINRNPIAAFAVVTIAERLLERLRPRIVLWVSSRLSPQLR